MQRSFPSYFSDGKNSCGVNTKPIEAAILCQLWLKEPIENVERAMQREAKDFELGEGMYCFVLVCSALVWQCFYLGAAGTIHCGSSLLSGVIIAMALPVTEVLAVIIYHEKFQQEKAVSLALSLWGFISYFYGESEQSKRNSNAAQQGTCGNKMRWAWVANTPRVPRGMILRLGIISRRQYHPII
ncbi:Purine permease 3-like protein [Drosera capensis]